MAENYGLAGFPPGSPEAARGNTDVRGTLEEVISKLMAQEPTKVPMMTPEEIARRRQLGTLGMLSGDRPMGLVGAENLRDVEREQARHELLANREEVNRSARIQGALGLLSARDIAKDREETRRQLAELGRANKPQPAMTMVTSEDGSRHWVDSHTGDYVKPVEIGGKPAMTPLSEGARKEQADLSQQINATDLAIKGATDYPAAFGTMRGIPGGIAGQFGESVAGKFNTPEETDARSQVFNVMSSVIKQRAGTAQSASELRVISSFLPSPYDDDKQIIAKMKGYKTYLEGQKESHLKGLGRSSPTPAVPNAPAPTAPANAKAAREARIAELERIQRGGR